ncbi:MAG TPA: CPBP family intramembrane metalloprotease [Oscillatoriales cyanobacterium M59_W2019_021]|nr:CPBP family intramembrane metalloprotease [Oscillatoriales cyanobacterium M4454_W2019_049]HIK50597.1 CPBP family intramembrane metalloprotease [Oscillatoriales cyanobacterium M59_W2019_021]
MTIKQFILIGLTVLTVAFVSLSLLGSVTKPQIQSQLELYQTNLVLQATEWQPEADDASLTTLRESLFGEDVFEEALKQYRNIRESVAEDLARMDAELAKPIELQDPELSTNRDRLETLRDTIDLRLGILQAHQDDTAGAIATWQALQSNPSTSETTISLAETAIDLWDDDTLQCPNRERSQIQANLDGWFRDEALERLYRVEGDTDNLDRLQVDRQNRAAETAFKLILLNGTTVIFFALGIGLLIFLGWQRVVKGKEAILALNSVPAWSIPWNWEIACQVIVVGFFLTFYVGQYVAAGLVVPIILQLLGLAGVLASSQVQAISILGSYALAAAAGLGVMYLSLESFRPLGDRWFRFQLRWRDLLWGLGGYWVAIPLVVGISLINQQLWQGQGGSNPILEIALQERDWLAIACFFLTASIAAPVFEELIFRGFLLPALTAYLPVWGAIAFSSLVFAVAHFSLSEVLPLATLGVVLGVVYARSGNLFASMFLHSVWNAGTLLSLFVLGSGAA